MDDGKFSYNRPYRPSGVMLPQLQPRCRDIHGTTLLLSDIGCVLSRQQSHRERERERERVYFSITLQHNIYRVFQKTDPLVYFDDNFGKYGPILTIFSLLQQEIHGAHK